MKICGACGIGSPLWDSIANRQLDKIAMKFLVAIFLDAAFFPLTSMAQGFRGTIDFSAEEKAIHQQHIDTITRVARRFLEDIWREHQAFYRRHVSRNFTATGMFP